MARPPRKTQDIRICVPINAAPDTVYRALISARELCVWWLDRAETEARNMGRLRLVWSLPDRKKSMEVRGVFVDLEKNGKVAWIWDEKSRPEGVPPLVSFFVEAKGKGSEVTLVHAGFSAAVSRKRLLENFKSVWEDAISKLKLYLDSGRTCKGEQLTLADVDLFKKAGRR